VLALGCRGVAAPAKDKIRHADIAALSLELALELGRDSCIIAVSERVSETEEPPVENRPARTRSPCYYGNSDAPRLFREMIFPFLQKHRSPDRSDIRAAIAALSCDR